MAELTPEELANIEQLAREKNKEKQLRRMRALARAAEVGAYISGQHDLAEGFGAAAEGTHAYGEGAGHRAGGMRKAGGNLAGSQAGKFAKRRGVGGGKAAGIGGAVAGAIQGGSPTDIAKSAASWYLLWLAFGALFTLAGSVPALIYLNFHFVMSKLGSKLFGEMTFLQKLGLLAADFIAIFLILIVIVVPIAVIAGMCDSSSDIGGSTLGILVRGSSALGAYGLGPFGDYCSAFSGIAAVVDKGVALMCSTPQIIAQQTGVLFPPEDDGDLKKLTDCVRGRVPNAGSVFTFEQDNQFCNASRGDDQYEGTCGRCAHSENSCHYGGSSGSTGSLAVDFGGSSGRGNEGVIGPQILQATQACSQSLGIGIKRSTCEAESATQPNGDNWVFCDDPRANHVHVSLAICDRDNGPINSR